MKFPRIKRSEPSAIMDAFKLETQKQRDYHDAEVTRLRIIVSDANDRIANHSAAADALTAAILSINVSEELRDDAQTFNTLSAH